NRGQQSRMRDKGAHPFYSGSTMLRCFMWHCRFAARISMGVEWLSGRFVFPGGRREVR
ncbi:hypothetical protein QBC32DRAFT_185172, partial [Pseudoneurospora amorphoporcata]